MKDVVLESVTVGEILAFLDEQLDRQTKQLRDLIHEGRGRLKDADLLLTGDIDKTLTLIDTIRSQARTALIRRPSSEPVDSDIYAGDTCYKIL